MKSLTVALTVAMMLGGCSTIGSWFGDSKQHEPTPLHAISTEQALQTKWMVNIGDASEGAFKPQYRNGNLYVANTGGSVSVLDAVSGRQIKTWSVPKTRFSTGVGVSDEAVFVGTHDGGLLALDRDSGAVRWQQKLTSVLLEPPMLMDNGVLVIRSNDGRVTGFDATDGRQLWSNPFSMPSLLIRNLGSMGKVDAQAFLLGLPAGRLQAVNSLNGETLWEGVVAHPRGATELDKATDIVSFPLYDNGQICAVAFQGRVSCFNIQTGEQQWSSDVSSSKGLTVNGNALFVTADDGTVLAFDRLSGERLWGQDGLRYRGVSAPALLGEYVLVVDAEGGYVHLISAATGNLVGRLKTELGELASPPQSFGDTVLLQDKKGRLVYLGFGGR